jgi:hypothetical protein
MMFSILETKYPLNHTDMVPISFIKLAEPQISIR